MSFATRGALALRVQHFSNRGKVRHHGRFVRNQEVPKQSEAYFPTAEIAIGPAPQWSCGIANLRTPLIERSLASATPVKPAPRAYPGRLLPAYITVFCDRRASHANGRVGGSDGSDLAYCVDKALLIMTNEFIAADRAFARLVEILPRSPDTPVLFRFGLA